VVNLGNTPVTVDTIFIGVNPSWVIFPQEINLAVSGMANVTGYLLPPREYSTAPGTYNFTVETTLAEDPTNVNVTYDQFMVTSFFASNITSNPSSISGQIGTTATYKVNVTNEGNVPSEYTMTSALWNTSIVNNWTMVSPASLILAPGEYGLMNLTVAIPYFWTDMTSINATSTIIVDKVNESATATFSANLTVESTPVSWVLYIISNLNSMQTYVNQSTDSCLKEPLLASLNTAVSLLNSSLAYFDQAKVNTLVILDIITQQELQFTIYAVDFASFFGVLPSSLCSYLHGAFAARQSDMDMLLGLTVNVVREDTLGTTLTAIDLEQGTLTAYAYANSPAIINLVSEAEINSIESSYAIFYYLSINDSCSARSEISCIEDQYSAFLGGQDLLQLLGITSSGTYAGEEVMVSGIDVGLNALSGQLVPS
jgi:hypothetical protein